MKVSIRTTTEVTRCAHCPHCSTTMDGPTCSEMEKKCGLYNGFVYPEGRYMIHPKCPLARKDRRLV